MPLRVERPVRVPFEPEPRDGLRDDRRQRAPEDQRGDHDGPNRQVPRRPQRGVGDHGHERAVEAVLLRQARQPGVGHPLRHDQRGDGGARGQVPEEVLARPVGAEPVEAGEGRGEVVEWRVGLPDAAEAVFLVGVGRERKRERDQKKMRVA